MGKTNCGFDTMSILGAWAAIGVAGCIPAMVSEYCGRPDMAISAMVVFSSSLYDSNSDRYSCGAWGAGKTIEGNGRVCSAVRCGVVQSDSQFEPSESGTVGGNGVAACLSR